MNQKILCGVLSAAVLLGVFPTAAFAAGDFTTVTSHILDFRNVEEDCSDAEMGWEWDADGQVLTLEDFRISVPQGKLENDAAIYLPKDSTIEVEGDNNEIQTLSYHCDAIYCEGELWFEGDGTLKITTTSYSASAIYAKGGPVVFCDKVEIVTEPEGYVIYVDKAKGQKPIISVQDDAKVTFPKDEADDRSVLVTHSSSVKPASNWLDYAEEYDEWDDTINLVAKPAETKSESAEETSENPGETASANEYQITIGSPSIVKNGEVSYTADVSPYLSNGYTMLPLRALLEVSNPDQDVKWSAEQKAAYTFVNNKLVIINPGLDTYKKGTDKIELSTPAETKNGRLFVSLRDWMNIMEIDGSQLGWNPETKTVTLKY